LAQEAVEDRQHLAAIFPFCPLPDQRLLLLQSPDGAGYAGQREEKRRVRQSPESPYKRISHGR
jgi:hypothetical protein